MSAPLWPSDDCAGWSAELVRYPATLAAQGIPELVTLDRWYADEFPTILSARHPCYITRGELEKVTRWKMRRGVWRERNRLLVGGNDAALVRRTSREAFQAIPDPRAPVAILSSLAGVGPATASAVLAAYRPDLYPFFDEWIAGQIPGLGPVAFTPRYYQSYAAALRDRAAALDGLCPDGHWSAHAVGQALWAHSGGKALR